MSMTEQNNMTADERYCYDCIHNEVCRWCPHDGCDFKETQKEAAKSDTECTGKDCEYQMSIENSYINAIISMVAKYHAVSPKGLLEAWNKMEQYKDVCYAKTADDIINALGWLADLYAVYGEKAGRVLRRVWICTECHHEQRSLADYIERSFSQTGNPRGRYQVLKQIIWEIAKRETGKKLHNSHKESDTDDEP